MAFDKSKETKEQRKARKALTRAEKAARQRLQETAGTDTPVQINVLCVRFGNKYGQEYVIKLRNMVERHLNVPYKFWCLTDDPAPIEGVTSIIRPNQGYQKGWWHKVHMFESSMPISGRILYMDLDVVIHNNIDKLATMWTEDFVGIRDFNRKFHPGYKYLNSSVMAWNAGSQNYIFDNFKQNPEYAMRMQGDQDWTWAQAKKHMKFWPDKWIQSYKWEIRSRSELGMQHGIRKFKTIRDDIVPDKECCIAVFHGEPNPAQVQDKFVVDNWQ